MMHKAPKKNFDIYFFEGGAKLDSPPLVAPLTIQNQTHHSFEMSIMFWFTFWVIIPLEWGLFSKDPGNTLTQTLEIRSFNINNYDTIIYYNSYFV